jgi:hypothetical protein
VGIDKVASILKRMINYEKMSKGLKIVLTIAFFIFLQQFVIAQDNQNQKFLQKVGIEDSLYSEILKETRTIFIQLPTGYDPDKNMKYAVVCFFVGKNFLPNR